jgi:NAD-dependent DNA ligase
MATSTLIVKGIGPVTADVLAEHGYNTVKKLAKASEKKLAKVPGFGLLRARATIAYSIEALQQIDASSAAKKSAKKAGGKKVRKEKPVKKKADKASKKKKDKPGKKNKSSKKNKHKSAKKKHAK